MSFTDRATDLTEDELDAMARASTWYANYFAEQIAGDAGESHAYAVEARRGYLDLVSALRKLGIRYAVPDALQPQERQPA
jgi:hypothetical protein